MSYGIFKRDNEYARQILDIDASKTVWMAIAYSLAMRLTADGAEGSARDLLRKEWQTLYRNGIVPQRPRTS